MTALKRNWLATTALSRALFLSQYRGITRERPAETPAAKA